MRELLVLNVTYDGPHIVEWRQDVDEPKVRAAAPAIIGRILSVKPKIVMTLVIDKRPRYERSRPPLIIQSLANHPENGRSGFRPTRRESEPGELPF